MKKLLVLVVAIVFIFCACKPQDQSQTSSLNSTSIEDLFSGCEFVKDVSIKQQATGPYVRGLTKTYSPISGTVVSGDWKSCFKKTKLSIYGFDCYENYQPDSLNLSIDGVKDHLNYPVGSPVLSVITVKIIPEQDGYNSAYTGSIDLSNVNSLVIAGRKGSVPPATNKSSSYLSGNYDNSSFEFSGDMEFYRCFKSGTVKQ